MTRLLFWIAFALPAQEPAKLAPVRQGDTVRLESKVAVTARMDGRTVRLYPQPDGGNFGLMPVPALAKPGSYPLELLDEAGAVLERLEVTVRDARFPVQNVVMTKAVKELQPSSGEMETVAAFRAKVTPTRFWAEPLKAPLAGCVISPFGVKRYHNGKPTGNYHGGLDQRGAAGSPVRAVAAGIVELVRQYNIHGGTVGIDHGQGLGSIYLHMSKFAVKEGDRVNAGDIVGYVGSTGRSTGPHLHWSLYVNGIPVNPVQWVPVKRCAPAPAKGKRQ